MRRIRLTVGLLVASATLPLATACMHRGQAAGDVAPSSAIGLTVTNNNFLDVDVFTVSDGVSTRLGTVSGNSKRTFTLSPSVASRDLRIIADPIGGNDRASSGQLVVSPGQTIDFQIGTLMRNSTASVRSPNQQ